MLGVRCQTTGGIPVLLSISDSFNKIRTLTPVFFIIGVVKIAILSTIPASLHTFPNIRMFQHIECVTQNCQTKIVAYLTWQTPSMHISLVPLPHGVPLMTLLASLAAK